MTWPKQARRWKIVETLYSNRVTSESKTVHTPKLSPPFNCFLLVARTAAQDSIEGMGEEKLYFPLLKSVKRQKAPLGRSVSTNFVASCRIYLAFNEVFDCGATFVPSTMQTWGVCTLLLIGNLPSSPNKCVTVTVCKAFILNWKDENWLELSLILWDTWQERNVLKYFALTVAQDKRSTS